MIMSPIRHLLVLFVTCLTSQLTEAQTISLATTSVTVDETAGSVTITLTHSPAPTSIWGATAATADGTATMGSDYTAVPSGPIVGSAGVSTIDVVIPILDDAIFDPAETFTLLLTALSTSQPDVTVTITITDDERIPVNLTQLADVTVKENVGNYSFTISRNDATNHDFNVSIDTMDVAMGNMATAGADYHPLVGVFVSFAQNENSQTAYVTIIDDLIAESTETFCMTISGPQIAENITFYIHIEDNDTPDNYHCGRGISQPCLNDGNCTLSDGTCDCPVGFEGENCGIETANITTGCGCVNGTCVDDGTQKRCICDGGFAGELCDMKAYFHQCETNGFSVCITPFSVETFSGIMYVMGKQAFPECVLGLAPSPSVAGDNIVDWCVGYAAFIDFNSTCGELGPNEMDGVTSYELNLRAQFSNNTLRSTDELVTFTCQYNNGSLTLSSSFNTVNPDSTGTNVQREISDVVPAELLVSDVGGNAIGNFVNIGEIIRFCISVYTVDAFEAVVIDNVIANNSRAGLDNRYLPLYQRGCVPSDAVGIITEGPYFDPDTQKHTMCFKLEVFIFSHDVDLFTPVVRVDIDITVHADAIDANEHVCGRRKKRQAVLSEANRLGTTLYLINPDAVKQESFQDVSSTCSCSSWLVPALIGLGVIAITMAVVIIVLTVTVIRHYKNKKIP